MLDLEYNGLKSLAANCFSGSGALRSLNLARNDLTRASDQSFAGLFNLRELDLYNTDFKCRFRFALIENNQLGICPGGIDRGRRFCSFLCKKSKSHNRATGFF